MSWRQQTGPDPQGQWRGANDAAGLPCRPQRLRRAKSPYRGRVCAVRLL